MCASEECAVMGCRRVREIQQNALNRPVQAHPWMQPSRTPSPTKTIPIGVTVPATPLTEADVRRIFKEELAGAIEKALDAKKDAAS
jgi:hypothetical protein